MEQVCRTLRHSATASFDALYILSMADAEDWMDGAVPSVDDRVELNARTSPIVASSFGKVCG